MRKKTLLIRGGGGVNGQRTKRKFALRREVQSIAAMLLGEAFPAPEEAIGASAIES